MHKRSRLPTYLALLALLQVQCLLAQSNTSTSSTADMVCAPSIGCLQGQVTAKAGVRISIPGNPNSSAPASALLLPGTYTTRSSAGANSTLLDPFFSSTSVTASSNTGFQIGQQGTTSSNVNGVAASISQSSGLIIYSSTFFAGSSSLLSFNDSFIQNATSSFTPLSFLLSSNVRAVANLPTSGNGMQRVVLWSGSADAGQLPLQLRSGNWEISDIQGTTCSPACASGGVCSLDGKCVCAAGFTGASCDQCEEGRFGPSCTPCSTCSNGSTCEEGIAGSGRCIPPASKPDAEACDCVNGVCAGGTGLCTCSPGWTDAAGGKKCSVCRTGFYQDSTGDCVACAPGCVACAANTGTCSSCAPGLSPSNDNPQQCIAARFLPSNGTTFTSCADGTFLSSGQTCSACNSACETCSGAGVDQCLSCSSGRGLLQGRCVAVDASTGVCDGSILDSSNALAYLFNNEKKVCDTLPAGCTAGSNPSPSSSNSRSSIQCSRCLGGLFLVSGRCVSSCATGFFATSTDAPSCQACSSSCATCEGSADFCTSCPAGQIAVNGRCSAGTTCPSGFFRTNDTQPCTPCHPDCATCSDKLDSCTSCPSGRPVLTASRNCVPTCSSNQYFEAASGSCRTCDASCASCAGPGPTQCMACPARTVLQQGSCVPASCAITTSLGVCLEDLVNVKSRTSLPTSDDKGKKVPFWVYIIVSLGIIGLLALLIVLWRLRALRKRAEKTSKFSFKKGLVGLFGFGKQDKEKQKEDLPSIHDQIEMVRTPTPPPYSYANPWPAHTKPEASESGSARSPTFSDIYGHGWYNPPISNKSALAPPSAAYMENNEKHQSGSRLKPLQLRQSGTSSWYSRASGRSPGFITEEERHQRQKALEALTGGDKQQKRQGSYAPFQQ